MPAAIAHTSSHPLPSSRASVRPAGAMDLVAITLPAPYVCQRDRASGQGLRMCFSSTCSMAAESLRHGCLAGSGQPDDLFLKIVRQFVDTTEAHAQIEALRSLGIQAELHTDGTPEQLLAQLRLGIPIPVGWLHQGPVVEPRSGGHWSLVIAWDPAREAVWMHDPNGEALLIGGGYVSTAIGSGRKLRYSLANWERRWMVEGPGSGWWLELAG